jgi:ankyrin repeat protein
LSKALTLKDFGSLGEPPMVKALRKDRYDLFEIMLGINPKIMTYEVLCLQDDTEKNILHHAVIKQHQDLVKKLIYLDSDHGKLRACKDTKGKTP